MTLSRLPTRCKHCKVKFTAEERGKRLHPECIEPWTVAFQEKQKQKAIRERKAKQRVEKAQDRKKRADLKTWSEHHADTQKAVNTKVRVRDEGKPCISCGAPWSPTFQAGHYRSRGAAKNLALDDRNVHGQCVQCNLHRHGNAIDFRLGLIARYGIPHVEALEADNTPRHHSIDDLKAIRAAAIAETKELKRSRG